MDYKIIADSSADLDLTIRERIDIEQIPFNISVDGEEFIDDDNLDFDSMMDKMIKSPNPVKTSCPAPGDYMKAYKENDNVFVVTISEQLSGSYNSAVLAKEMVLEEEPDKFIHVFNSKSASAGCTLVCLKIKESIEKGLDEEQIIVEVEEYIEQLNTFFILESLDNLIKNGRITKTKGLIASVLNFKPIMRDDGNGEIILEENIRGSKRAYNELINIVERDTKDMEEKRLLISHNNADEWAGYLKDEIEKRCNFKEVLVVKTQGLSGSYAYDGGIVLAY